VVCTPHNVTNREVVSSNLTRDPGRPYRLIVVFSSPSLHIPGYLDWATIASYQIPSSSLFSILAFFEK
jgi:hypothetical protein